MAESPEGKRPPAYLYEMALGRIEDLMRQAYPWTRVVAIMSSEGYTDSEATLKDWRREVMRRWAAEDAEIRPARKDLWRARLEALYHDLLERAPLMQGYAQAAMFSEAIKVAKLAIVLDGAQAPITIKHEGRIDVAAMSPAERENEIAQLLKKRDAAIAASRPARTVASTAKGN